MENEKELPATALSSSPGFQIRGHILGVTQAPSPLGVCLEHDSSNVTWKNWEKGTVAQDGWRQMIHRIFFVSIRATVLQIQQLSSEGIN